jgi:hypothetical protein
MKRVLLVFLPIIPGVLVAGVCCYFALNDWETLRYAYANYRNLAASHPNMQALFVAHAEQNIHRINLFADGVWALLGTILAGIGIHAVAVQLGSDLESEQDIHNLIYRSGFIVPGLIFWLCCVCFAGPIHGVASAGDASKVGSLLRDNPKLVNSRDEVDDDCYPPCLFAVLHVAAMQGKRWVSNPTMD